MYPSESVAMPSEQQVLEIHQVSKELGVRRKNEERKRGMERGRGKLPLIPVGRVKPDP